MMQVSSVTVHNEPKLSNILISSAANQKRKAASQPPTQSCD